MVSISGCNNQPVSNPAPLDGPSKPASDLWRAIQANTTERVVADQVSDAKLKVNASKVPCYYKDAVEVNVNDGGNTTQRFIHANSIKYEAASGSGATEGAVYQAGQSPDPLKEDSKLADPLQNHPVLDVVAQAIDTKQGIFQFVSPVAHHDPENSAEKPIFYQLKKLLELAKPGNPLKLVGRYEVKGVEEKPDANPSEQTPADSRRRVYLVTVTDIDNGEQIEIPITQVGLSFTGSVLTGENIALANTFYEQHQTKVKELKAPANAPQAQDENSKVATNIVSYAGIGRNATLICYREIKRRIDAGDITDKNQLNQQLKDVVVEGRKVRGQHFIHSEKQLAELQLQLDTYLNEKDAASAPNPATQTAPQTAPQAAPNNENPATTLVTPSKTRKTSDIKPIVGKEPSGINTEADTLKKTEKTRNITRVNITKGLSNIRDSCYANATFKFIASHFGIPILKHLKDLLEKTSEKSNPVLHKAIGAFQKIMQQLLVPSSSNTPINSDGMRELVKPLNNYLQTKKTDKNPAIQIGDGIQHDATELAPILAEAFELNELDNKNNALELRTCLLNQETNAAVGDGQKRIDPHPQLNVALTENQEGAGFEFDQMFKQVNHEEEVSYQTDDGKQIKAKKQTEIVAERIDSLQHIKMHIAPYTITDTNQSKVITLNNINYDHKFTQIVTDKNSNNQYVVTLQAQDVIAHSGLSLNRGHYVTFTRDADGETWSKHNDGTVTQNLSTAAVNEDTDFKPVAISFKVLSKTALPNEKDISYEV